MSSGEYVATSNLVGPKFIAFRATDEGATEWRVNRMEFVGRVMNVTFIETVDTPDIYGHLTSLARD